MDITTSLAIPGLHNVRVEVVEHKPALVGNHSDFSVRVIMKSTNGEWVVDVADGESPMFTVETPSGGCHDVTLNKKGDINIWGLSEAS